MYTHGILRVDIDSRVPIGALGEALLSPEGIAIGHQLSCYLGRVIYCPGHVGDAGTMLRMEGYTYTWCP